MSNDASRRWLVNATFATLIMGMATFLPWIGFGEPTVMSVNGFQTSLTDVLRLPNWLPLAECVLVAVFAAFQYSRIAEKSSFVPIVLSILAFSQAVLMLFLTIAGQEPPVDPASQIVTFNLFSGLYRSPKIEIGILIAVIATGWLAISAVLYKIAPAATPPSTPVS